MEHGRAALELYAGLKDPAGLAHAQWLVGLVLADGGERSSGPQLVADALASFRRLGDRWGVAAALSVRAWEQLRRGELPDARRDGEESRSLFIEVGDRWGQVRCTDLLGVLAEIEGNYEHATALHTDGLRLAEELALWPVVTQQLGRLGRLAVLGQLETAETKLVEVLGAHRVAGFHPGIAFVAAELGFVAELRGDAQEAQARHLESLASAQISGDPRAIALALEGLAGADALTGHHDRAGWLLGAADAARCSVDRPLPSAERIDVDRISSAVQAALGEAAFDTARRRGAAAGLDAVLATLDLL